ncbi:hypothetical protein AAHA92_21140 [Salvia divinorum]|uniref:PXA domain-containing protein n=1 Tax=Salvia divinorum TaxID=28513 RepID=A0ABD1GJI3_SALDI
MKTLADGIQDLIREAKLRTVWWILCIFAVTYILTHTSKPILMNVPIAVLLVAGLRMLFNEVDFQWKTQRSDLVELLTRDIVDLIGDHIDLIRRNQTDIGRDVMGTLSSEERDEKLKRHHMASKELHPALISPVCEYKIGNQQLMGGLLAAVLRPTEARCPLIRCIARELLTCLIIQPLVNFVNPVYSGSYLSCFFSGYINEIIEYIIALCTEWFKDLANARSTKMAGHSSGQTVPGITPSQFNDNKEQELGASGNSQSTTTRDEHIHAQSAEWAKVFEAATQRRTEVLEPENLENMWTIGRNYKKDFQKKPASELQAPERTSSVGIIFPIKELVSDIQIEDKARNNASVFTHENRRKFKRSNSISHLEVRSKLQPIITNVRDLTPDGQKGSAKASHNEVLYVPKLRCRVIGAYFEKLGSNSFAVYSIAVLGADNITWFVKRR